MCNNKVMSFENHLALIANFKQLLHKESLEEVCLKLELGSYHFKVQMEMVF